MNRIAKITISGPTGCGKALIANIIEKALIENKDYLQERSVKLTDKINLIEIIVGCK